MWRGALNLNPPGIVRGPEYCLLSRLRDSRHTHATWLSESGATIRAAQDILGQSDVETTLRVYTHSVPESKRRAVANVAALLFPSVPLREGQQEQRQEPVN
jgi:integrase